MNKDRPCEISGNDHDVASGAPTRWEYVDDITVGESRSISAVVLPSVMAQIIHDLCSQADDDHMDLSISKCCICKTIGLRISYHTH